MRNVPFSALALSAALSAALCGCAVGPNFHRPAPPATQTYGAAPAPVRTEGQILIAGASPAGQWWRSFGSPELDRLMAAALTQNSDLAAARAALRAARETYLAQRGALLPSIDVQAQAQRARNSESLAPPLANNAINYSLFSGQLSVGYTIDLFGGVRRATEAAHAQAEQQQFEAEAAYLALTSNVANAFVQLAALRDQLRQTQALLEVDEQLASLVRLQHDKGQVSGAELAQAEAQLAQARNALSGLRKQISQQDDLLAALCGSAPSELGEPPAELSELRLPGELPVSLPAQMVRQRPDVRAAEAAVHAASAQLGVAIANRLPSLSISAAAGGASPQIGSVLSPANQLWSITGGLAQPIFQGGALLHRQRAAQAALDEAQAQYRSAVLAGFQNVADVLAAVASDAEALSAEQAAAAASERNASLAALRHRLGQGSGVDELNARSTALQAEIARSQAQAARLTDSIALFVALGGGWEARNDFGVAAGSDRPMQR
jgi:NodT family efflux transporter outer membrane factor (OMF) lipoprotein